MYNDELGQISGGFEVTSREAFHSREQGRVLSDSMLSSFKLLGFQMSCFRQADVCMIKVHHVKIGPPIGQDVPREHRRVSRRNEGNVEKGKVPCHDLTIT